MIKAGLWLYIEFSTLVYAHILHRFDTEGGPTCIVAMIVTVHREDGGLRSSQLPLAVTE